MAGVVLDNAQINKRVRGPRLGQKVALLNFFINGGSDLWVAGEDLVYRDAADLVLHMNPTPIEIVCPY